MESYLFAGLASHIRRSQSGFVGVVVDVDDVCDDLLAMPTRGSPWDCDDVPFSVCEACPFDALCWLPSSNQQDEPVPTASRWFAATATGGLWEPALRRTVRVDGLKKTISFTQRAAQPRQLWDS